MQCTTLTISLQTVVIAVALAAAPVAIFGLALCLGLVALALVARRAAAVPLLGLAARNGALLELRQGNHRIWRL